MTGFCSDCCPTTLSENDRLDRLMTNTGKRAFFCQRILKRKVKVLEAIRELFMRK